MNAKKLQCLTTAAWLRGYAGSLDEYTYSSVIHKMRQAADLLAETWDEYAVENGYADIKVPATEPQEERNFCPRCGKLTKDIHTCTPPETK